MLRIFRSFYVRVLSSRELFHQLTCFDYTKSANASTNKPA